MKQLIAPALLAATLALPAPLMAQEEGEMEEGFSLVEEGMRLFFRGLSKEMEPALEEMRRELEPALRDLAEAWGPAMQQIAGMIDEFDNYHPPEKLPNGDIIIRRKSAEEIEREERPGPLEGFDPEGEIEL